jgi:hypothetical protein
MRTLARALLVALVAAPAAAGAQQWRTIETARQLGSVQPLTVYLKYAAGKLDVSPVEGALLYQMRIRYDEQMMDAVHTYDAAGQRLTLGLSSADVGWKALKNSKNHEGSMSVGLSPAVPMDLEVALGGAEAKLELGGLRIHSLRMESGLAGTTINFETPNPITMEEMKIDLGLGAVRLENLGNANVAAISIDGGLGGVSLDFGEGLLRDVKITSHVALGSLRIDVPEDVGVMVQGTDSFDREIAFTRAENAWYSMNWKQASRRITIVATTRAAKLQIGPSGR